MGEAERAARARARAERHSSDGFYEQQEAIKRQQDAAVVNEVTEAIGGALARLERLGWPGGLMMKVGLFKKRAGWHIGSAEAGRYAGDTIFAPLYLLSDGSLFYDRGGASYVRYLDAREHVDAINALAR